ncbi:substrate-binding domain-containing protein [Cellulomonas soli]
MLGAPHEGAHGTSTLRYEGYCQALEAAGLEVDQRLVAWTDDGWHRSNGALAITGVLESGVVPDGVVAFNDALAVGAMHELQVRGLRVPDDVAVVGFDDTEDARYTLPTLTTVDGGRAEIARVAVDLLARRIAGRGPEEPVLHHAAMRVVERGARRSAEAHGGLPALPADAGGFRRVRRVGTNGSSGSTLDGPGHSDQDARHRSTSSWNEGCRLLHRCKSR